MQSYTVKFSDPDSEDFTIACDSLRIDVFRRPSCEIERIRDAYNLYAEEIFLNASHFLPMMDEEAGLETMLYLPAFEAFDVEERSGSYKFPYSVFLRSIVSAINYGEEIKYNSNSSFVKIMEEIRDYSGNMNDLVLVELLQYFSADDSVFPYWFNRCISENFPYVDDKTRNNLLNSFEKHIKGQSFDKPCQSSTPASQSRRMRKENIETMRKWFRKGFNDDFFR